MELEEIKKNIETALLELYAKDNYLLQNNASERSIAHCLANHLKARYPKHDVDCEYNIATGHIKGQKKIYLTSEEQKKFKQSQTNNEREVFACPDIIIHKRENGTNNHLILELKRSTSSVSKEYDMLKLKRYTENSKESLKYNYGVFINIKMKLESGYKFDIEIFEDGKMTDGYQIARDT